MTHVTLVGCGGKKLKHAAPAAVLYTSNLFRKSAEWAVRQGNPWYIASAKHGLLHPATEVEPYNTRLGTGWDAPPIHQWAERVVTALRERHPDLERLTMLAGHTYIDPVRWELRDTDVEVLDPLAGLGIGQRLAWLTKENRDAA